MQEDRHAELIDLLDLTRTPDEDEHPVIDFTIKLLDILGYSRRDRVARTKMNLGFLACGERRYAEPDICIFDCSRGEVLAIVQVYKRLQLDMLDGTKSQLVAGAVAAFDENNAMRGEYSLRPLSQMVMYSTRSPIQPHFPEMLGLPLGHPRHRDEWDVAHILQNSYHPGAVVPHLRWDVSARGNACGVLLPARPSPSAP